MKKILPIFFLFVYVVASTELHQLIRVPIFVAHYMEHQLANPAISLSDFIVLHYFSGNAKFADYARDEQLPFKNVKCPEVSIAIALPPDDFPQTTAKVFSLSRNIVMRKSFLRSSSCYSSIWQPPRM